MKPALSSLLLLTPVLLMGCSHESQPVQAATPTAHAQLVKVTPQQIPQSIRTSGTVHAKETAMISAQMPGTIRQVLVQAGDRVRAGQLLIALDDSAMRSEVNRAMAAQMAVEKQQMAAQAGATLAAGTLARYQELKNEKSVSPQEFDEVQQRSEAAHLQLQALEAQSSEAKAAVAGARTQLEYMQLRAPFAGIVAARTTDPGTLATPGTPLLQIDRDGPLQLYTSVDESLIGSVRLGMKVPVSMDGIGASRCNSHCGADCSRGGSIESQLFGKAGSTGVETVACRHVCHREFSGCSAFGDCCAGGRGGDARIAALCLRAGSRGSSAATLCDPGKSARRSS